MRRTIKIFRIFAKTRPQRMHSAKNNHGLGWYRRRGLPRTLLTTTFRDIKGGAGKGAYKHVLPEMATEAAENVISGIWPTQVVLNLRGIIRFLNPRGRSSTAR